MQDAVSSFFVRFLFHGLFVFNVNTRVHSLDIDFFRAVDKPDNLICLPFQTGSFLIVSAGFTYIVLSVRQLILALRKMENKILNFAKKLH